MIGLCSFEQHRIIKFLFDDNLVSNFFLTRRSDVMTFMLPTLYNDVTVPDIFVDAVAILAVSLEIDAIYQSKLK